MRARPFAPQWWDLVLAAAIVAVVLGLPLLAQITEWLTVS
jgi:hypothetical protein